VYDAVERRRTGRLLDAVRDGQTVLLVSDAGMPLISDPGYVVVAAAIDEGLPVSVLPGPSAVTVALALSGLPTERFCFEGFLPRKSGERRARLTELASDRRTLVLFEAPHRVAAMLADLADVFGASRRAAVCRELTKVHEEVRRGTLDELVAWATSGAPRGEITVVVAGTPAHTEPPDPARLAAAVADRMAAGLSRRDAAAAVAAELGVSRRTAYEASVRA
jgi:16S rRNA (cytidine1402-2'-O)-methyltransferase